MKELKNIIKLIIKEPYYYNYYKRMENKNINELKQILINTLRVNINYENEIIKYIENENLNLNDFKTYNIFKEANTKGILILKYLILKQDENAGKYYF